MNNPNSDTQRQPNSVTPQSITQEVVDFMQLHTCIPALPGGYEALQAA